MLEPNEKLLLDIAEVSSLTGLSVGTLYHWVGERRIPFVRLSSRCIRFRRCDIEEWITGMAQPAQQPVQEHSLRGPQCRFPPATRSHK